MCRQSPLSHVFFVPNLFLVVRHKKWKLNPFRWKIHGSRPSRVGVLIRWQCRFIKKARLLFHQCLFRGNNYSPSKAGGLRNLVEDFMRQCHMSYRYHSNMCASGFSGNVRPNYIKQKQFNICWANNSQYPHAAGTEESSKTPVRQTFTCHTASHPTIFHHISHFYS